MSSKAFLSAGLVLAWCDTCGHMLFDNSQSDSVRKVHKATICENPLRALPRNDNLYLIGFQSGKERNVVVGGDRRTAIRASNEGGRGKELTLRGSPSPPESRSRREPPPGLGSTKSTPSMKAASGAGWLCTKGSNAAWRPNSDAKGIYIRGKDRGRGRRWGIKGSDRRTGSENKSSWSSLYTLPRFNSCKRAGGHGLFLFGGEEVWRLDCRAWRWKGDKPSQSLLHFWAGKVAQEKVRYHMPPFTACGPAPPSFPTRTGPEAYSYQHSTVPTGGALSLDDLVTRWWEHYYYIANRAFRVLDLVV
jgi:hypothetical protein